jgi:hypothetical protein
MQLQEFCKQYGIRKSSTKVFAFPAEWTRLLIVPNWILQATTQRDHLSLGLFTFLKLSWSYFARSIVFRGIKGCTLLQLDCCVKTYDSVRSFFDTGKAYECHTPPRRRSGCGGCVSPIRCVQKQYRQYLLSGSLRPGRSYRQHAEPGGPSYCPSFALQVLVRLLLMKAVHTFRR